MVTFKITDCVGWTPAEFNSQVIEYEVVSHSSLDRQKTAWKVILLIISVVPCSIINHSYTLKKHFNDTPLNNSARKPFNEKRLHALQVTKVSDIVVPVLHLPSILKSI